MALKALPMLRFKLLQIKYMERKTDVTRNTVCNVSVIIIVLSPPRNVYPQIRSRHIIMVNQNGTPISLKINRCKTIATKYRQEQESKVETQNYMRQYYDVCRLLDNKDVQEFIGSPEYLAHKKQRFPTADYAIPIAENEAFLLSSSEIRESFKKRYAKSKNLYYKGQPDFNDLLANIHRHIDKL